MKYGLQFSPIEDHHYYLGGGFIGTEEIQTDGQWDAFLPPEEIQNRNNVETMNCTVFGTINAIEILFNKLFHEVMSFSERYTGVLAETTPSGNDPHKVGEVIRKNGLIDEGVLPFDNTIMSWVEYYSPNPMSPKYLKLGKKFLESYEFKHEWVFRKEGLDEKVKLMKEALKRGPLAISVYAWDIDNEGICHKLGSDNHWVCCYGYNDHGWKLFDTYTNSYKLYSFESDIGMAKVYWLKKSPPKPKTIWSKLFTFIFGRHIMKP